MISLGENIGTVGQLKEALKDIPDSAFLNIGDRKNGFPVDKIFYDGLSVGLETNDLAVSQPISQKQIEAAKQCLIDNGIDADEAETVLQAIGYTLLNEELFPDKPASLSSKEPSLDSYVRTWYKGAYPDDPLGDQLSPIITFRDVVNALNHGVQPQFVWHNRNARIREHIFDALSQILYVPRQSVFDKFISPDLYPELQVNELAQQIARDPSVANGFHLISVEEIEDGRYGASLVQFGNREGLVSFAFSNADVQEAKVRTEVVLAEIIQKTAALKMPLWSDLSETMLELIKDSAFDMHFVEFEDEDWTKEKADTLWEESVSKGLDSVVRTMEDQCFVTVYAGAIGSVNWLDHPEYSKPCLKEVLAAPGIQKKTALSEQIQNAESKASAPALSHDKDNSIHR